MLIIRYQVLQYGQSQYVREFGLDVPNPPRLVELEGRIITAPRLTYNQESRQPNVVCIFSPSRTINDCKYMRKAPRKRCMEHVRPFLIMTILRSYVNIHFERLDRFMSEPVEIPNWLLIIYESTRHFNQRSARNMITDFVKGCKAVGKMFQASSTCCNHTKDPKGIKINAEPVLVRWADGQGNIAHVSCLTA